MSDFWTSKNGYKVYQNRALSKKTLKKKCPEECEWRMGDGTCDQDCNLLACLWDGDDCDGIAPDGGENMRRSTFYQSVDFVNVLFETTLTKKSERNWLPHIPIMFDIDIMKDMQDYYELYFSVTSHHKNRRKNDMQPEFSYTHWLKEAVKSEYVKVKKERYKYEIIKSGPIAYISYSNNMTKNIPMLEKELRSRGPDRKHTKVLLHW